jgi:hypothetical protein
MVCISFTGSQEDLLWRQSVVSMMDLDGFAAVIGQVNLENQPMPVVQLYGKKSIELDSYANDNKRGEN